MDYKNICVRRILSFQRKEPEYTKVRQKGRKLRDPHSESQGMNVL